MDDTDMMDVCLIGHSFVTRLHRYMQSSGRLQNLNLDVDKFRISVCTRGGLRVTCLKTRDYVPVLICLRKGLCPSFSFLEKGIMSQYSLVL